MKNRLTPEKAAIVILSLMALCAILAFFGTFFSQTLALTNFLCLYFLFVIMFILWKIEKAQWKRDHLINYDVMMNDQNYAEREKREEASLSI